jgi:hypothetical protein
MTKVDAAEGGANSCSGKQRFDTAGLAQSVLQRQRKRGIRPGSAYRCPICAGYHLGHSSGAKKAVKFRFEDGSE